MEENQASRTALLSAYVRGYHSKHVSPKIFDDPLASELLTSDECASFDQLLLSGLKAYQPALAASFPDEASALAFTMQIIPGPPQILSRAQFTEELLEEAIKQGAKQYILVGAGLDTFVFRKKELLPQLQVYEVDHPATQNHKLQRLQELKWDIPDKVCFVTADLTKEKLGDTLKRTSYNTTDVSFFNWQGVTYYLSTDEVLATLGNIAESAPAGSRVVFDYIDIEALDPRKVAPRMQGMMIGAQQMNEPIKAGFNPATFGQELEKIGLRLCENLSPSDIQARYFQDRADKYYALEQLYIACAEVK